MTKQIPLTQGKVALVSDHRFEYLNQWKWTASKTQGKRYAVNSSKGKMHRLITGAPVGMDVDHVDGDGLNNQDENLRVCTHAENGYNRRKLASNNTTGYKGVSIFRDGKFVRYQAKIRVASKLLHLGLFTTAEAAARAYDQAAREHFGDFAALNFPNDSVT